MVLNYIHLASFFLRIVALKIQIYGRIKLAVISKKKESFYYSNGDESTNP